MTGPLKDMMREQADAQASPRFDAADIAEAGDRRVRRTRATVGSLAVAAVTLAAVGLPQLLDGPGRPGADSLVAGKGQEAVGAFAERRPTYAVDEIIYYGRTTVDVGEEIGSFVQTDHGFVYATDDGAVHLADGATTEEIGRTSRDGLYLRADDTGSLVAWVEFTRDEAPALVVFDTARGQEVLRTAEGTEAGMTAFRDTGAVYVYAVDDGTVYWRNARGLVATDAASGSSEVLGPDASLDIQDVANGHFAHKVVGPEGGDTRIRVSTDLDEPAPPLPSGYDNGFLSPSARYVSVEHSDETAVYDTATRADVTPGADGYAFVAAYAWLDDSTVTMIGIEKLADGESPIDLLRCAVPSGDCQVVARAITTYDRSGPIRLALPVGERLG
jgi:hypothetical protein